MDARIFSLGSINADFQVRIPEPLGQSETLQASHLRRLSGGKAANVALLARRLGHEASLLGRVGDDDLAEQALAPLREAGIDLDGVCRARQACTAVSMIAVPPSGKKHILLAGEANLGFIEDDIRALERCVEHAPGGSVLVVNWEITPQAVSRAVIAARTRGLRIVADPAFPEAVDTSVLRDVDVLTPNESEARRLAGVQAPGPRGIETAARALAELGPRIICIKLEDGGCLLVHEGQLWHQPAEGVDVVDTTGAGDAFTGAFAVAMLENQSLLQAAAFAVAASQLAVTAYGSQPAYPTRARLDATAQSVGQRVATWRY